MRDPQRTQTVILKLTEWAQQQPLVRAMLLTSSLANPTAPVDELSDYDIVLLVSDIQPFSSGDPLLSDLGPILVRFRGSDPRYEDAKLTWLVLYEDGTKIDWTIWTVPTFNQLLHNPALPDNLDVGYQVLLDKDNLTTSLNPPTFQAHIPHKPTQQEFRALVEEFWWETTYVAKNLWRDELLPAQYSLDCVIKLDLLRRLLEWHIETQHGWSWKPGALGKGLKKHLPPETWAEIESTFVGPTIEENWTALFRTTALFRRIAIEVADHLGYEYPHVLDSQMMSYLYGIKDRESATPFT